ncbi:MAG: ATP-binding protein [bacterium]|nr:ATP-binding protein [bacterium]
MKNKLVRYSKAGDAFHYRWAARRCLRMIYPKSPIQSIVIEGSNENKLAGECVIDVAEYSFVPESNTQKIEYIQLKYTTVRKKKPFNLSDLKVTFEGFAKRYSEISSKKNKLQKNYVVTFSIVTNRPISEILKKNITSVALNQTVNARFISTLEKYANLNGNDLEEFCSLIKFVDGEGDYNSQHFELQSEISQFVAGTVDNPQINNVINLIQEKALPNSNGKITREDILLRFEVTSERDLYPAPYELEKIDTPILRKQHQEYLANILNTSTSIIIHAAGGVGKSIFAYQITQSLPNGSLGIIYDCFGRGSYLNRSKFRHRHCDALIQIANELAMKGLCNPLIAKSYTKDDEILRSFLSRIETAVRSLRKRNEKAVLVILIDAADNAEMAAEINKDHCFARDLLKEQLPNGCRLVELCRTERINLLQPSHTILQLELKPFSDIETLTHLRNYFPNASEQDGLEFHRLTNNGNPRVQANALNFGYQNIEEVLVSLGPSGTTIERQIEKQLDSAISFVKEKLPNNYQNSIDAICTGLVTLPPFIPINILATAAGVNEGLVRSFVFDLGRPLWITDNSVQFRDEPTETWFRQKFSATAEQITSYISCLKSLANTYTYVAETLPALFLRAGMYDELIKLAISDELLPVNSPIDERNVRVYRLQFAFKASLRLNRFADAAKLALRAGEEVAGDKRQLDLFMKNVDLIAPLQSDQKVQELAFRRILKGNWNGSENVYSAALLSSVNDFKGEARGYLRSAENWLHIYFEERKQNKNDNLNEKLRDEEIVELIFAHFNLFGSEEVVNFIQSWRPPEVVYRISSEFIRRLVDGGKFNEIQKIANAGSTNPYLMIAISRELLEVGRFINATALKNCLNLLCNKQAKILKLGSSYNDTTYSAIISFIEMCAANNLSKAKILKVIRFYFAPRAPRWIYERFQMNERDPYLRAVALKSVLNSSDLNLEDLLPKEFLKDKKKNKYKNENEVREFNEVIGGLLPWYILRAKMLTNRTIDFNKEIENSEQKSRSSLTHRWGENDNIPYEISKLLYEILSLMHSSGNILIEEFFNRKLKSENKIWIKDLIKATRCSFRLDHLSEIRMQIEQSAYELISSTTDEAPETKADWYVDLARSVLPVSREDAATYFNNAIEAVSKFGDEIVQRWQAIVTLANRSAQGNDVTPELTYRFIRSAELVGDYVEEKHWNRNEAIRICTRLSPSSALAALSRWRDRDVGWFKEQLFALACEIVSNKSIPSSSAWSLSAFLDGFMLDEFLSLCIEKENEQNKRQYLFDQAIHDLRLKETNEETWKTMKDIAHKFSLGSKELDKVLLFYSDKKEEVRHFLFDKDKKESFSYNQITKQEKYDWEKIFSGLDLASSYGIDQAITRLNSNSQEHHISNTFWEELFKRTADNAVLKFLKALIYTENINLYELKYAFSLMPKYWKQKASVKYNWENILKSIGQRFPTELTNRYTLKYFLETISEKEDVIPIIQEGILEGLCNENDLNDAETFFGFTELVAYKITAQEAIELLDFGLTRIEMHIDKEYADGNWSKWLSPPKNVSVALTGFIWAALGSPRSEIRWQAAHCIRRLADIGCKSEIESLISWMKEDKVDAFGSKKFPFYNLHARLYLLISLARISIYKPELLREYYDIFSYYALNSIPHILIQKFSAEIAINIEKSFPNTYNDEEVLKLGSVCISQLPRRKMKYQESLDGIWPNRKIADKKVNFYFGYDFDRYWFEPLGRVFGISGQKIEELATEVVVNDWGIKTDGSYKTDPRNYIWRSSARERETMHSHGSYPRTDDYGFYISYHSMFVVASKLLRIIPVVHRENWYEDEWEEWLDRHILTRRDGHWLSDRRDPVPLEKRNWHYIKNVENWRSEISDYDFLDGILSHINGKYWLRVDGYWDEADDTRRENFSIITALVPKATAQSLLNYLSSISNPYDAYLPNNEREGDDGNFSLYPFELTDWIMRNSTDNGLDKHDPYSGEIRYPPYQINNSIVKEFKLSSDSEKRVWYINDEKEPQFICEIWSSEKLRIDEDPRRTGIRISASLEFIKNLCKTHNCELIYKVEIQRYYRYKQYSRDDDETRYKPPHFKFFVLSQHGKLRDEKKSYKIR